MLETGTGSFRDREFPAPEFPGPGVSGTGSFRDREFPGPGDSGTGSLRDREFPGPGIYGTGSYRDREFPGHPVLSQPIVDRQLINFTSKSLVLLSDQWRRWNFG